MSGYIDIMPLDLFSQIYLAASTTDTTYDHQYNIKCCVLIENRLISFWMRYTVLQHPCKLMLYFQATFCNKVSSTLNY